MKRGRHARSIAVPLAFAIVLAGSVAVTIASAGAAGERSKSDRDGAAAKGILRLEPEARRRWPDSFAGVWMERVPRVRREFGLRPASLSLGAGERRTVTLAFEEAGAAAKLRRLLRRKSFRRGSIARIEVRARDAAGNSTAREIELKLVRGGSAGGATSRRVARGDPIELGGLSPGDPEDCGAARNNVQASAAAGVSYEVPADGVITRWRHNGNPADAGSGRLQVWRRAGGTSYTLVGRSALEVFAPGANSFATAIPVRRGDLLGLRADAAAGCAFGAGVGDVVRFDGFGATDPAPGATRAMSSDDPDLRVNVSATLQPDDGLALDIDAAARQQPDRLQLTLSCPDEACEAEISGDAVAARSSARNRVFVAFTDDARRRVGALRRGFPKPGMLRSVSFERSLRDLEQLQTKMIADREAFRETGAPFTGVPDELYDLDIDVTKNAPVVILEHPTDAATAAFRERYAPDVIVRAGPLAQPFALYPCKSRFDCPRLRAGLETAFSDTTPPKKGCTTGFIAHTGRSPKVGTLGVLSASHCGTPDLDLGSPRFHGTKRVQYGTVQRQQQFGRVDAEWHHVSQEPFRSLKPTAEIYVNQVDIGKVKRVGTWEELPIGSTVCKVGIRTLQSCGKVLSKEYSGVDYVPWSSRFVKADFCGQPGDSGGPVYSRIPGLKQPPGTPKRYTALGLVSGGPGLPCSHQDFYALFGHIEYAQQTLDVKVPLAATP
ncbi:MAG: S1 family peptidase [Solirubrobacterales bacterium]